MFHSRLCRRALVCASVVLLLLGQSTLAASVSPDMNKAITKLVDAQQLDKHWPSMVDAGAQRGAEKVFTGFMAAAQQGGALDAADKQRATALIQKYAPQIAADVTRMHRGLNARQFMLDWAVTYYPKFFDVAEIGALSDFYGGPAFQSMVGIQLDSEREHARTGADVNLIRERLANRLSASDKAALLAFSNSAAGHKEQGMSPEMASSLQAFWDARFKDEEARLLRPYITRMTAEFKAGQQR